MPKDLKHSEKREPKEKIQLHPRNRHRAPYDFKTLIVKYPELAAYAKPNIYGDTTIDFFNPEAVKILNQILLRSYYDVTHWDIPANYLCPPIPGRADFLHYLADLLAEYNGGVIPTGKKIRCLDIGVGANCIYPIVGIKEYGWSFVGADIDSVALKTAGAIVAYNPSLKGKVELRTQPKPHQIFIDIIRPGEYFDMTICNPPFHASFEEAESRALRKYNGLTQRKNSKAVLNFGGQSNELWCEGGEVSFLSRMVRQSREYSTSVFWFSSLVSKNSTLEGLYSALEKAGAVAVKTIPMAQGNKLSRVVAWTFLTKEQQEKWIAERWKP